MKGLTFLLLFAAFALAGCGSTEQTKSGGNQTAANSSPTKPAENKSSDTASVKTETGVAACDEYLARIEKCMNNPNVPQATRDAWKQSLEQNRGAWKQAASTAQGKASLETSCKMAMDSAKPMLDQYCK